MSIESIVKIDSQKELGKLLNWWGLKYTASGAYPVWVGGGCTSITSPATSTLDLKLFTTSPKPEVKREAISIEVYEATFIRTSEPKVSPEAYSATHWLSQATAPSADDPFGVKQPTLIWSKHKGLKPNARKLELGMEVAIEGLPFPQVVDSLSGDSCMVENSNVDYPISQTYPTYTIEPTDKNIKIGSLVVNTKGAYGFIKYRTIGGGYTVDASGGTVDCSLSELEGVISYSPELIQVDSFTCGAFTAQGKTYYSKEDLEASTVGRELNITTLKISIAHKEISNHYGVDYQDLHPKDSIIMEELKETLDHPLNIADKEWCLLVGPSGSGKTQLAIEYAKERGNGYITLPCSAQTTVDDLVGWKSVVDGVYIPSLLRDAVENGKVCILDEADAANSNTMLVLNSLKQDHFQFPDKLVEVHKDFRLIATANTLEYDEQYNARSPMDKATLARFHIIKYNLKDYELALRYGFNYVKTIDTTTLTPREVQRAVTRLKIKESK